MRISFISCFVFIFVLSEVFSETTVVPIVGLFDNKDSQQEIAFKYAVDRVNMDRMLLPKIKLELRKDQIAPHDSFTAERKVCNHTQRGVGAVFGPQTTENIRVVKSVCETLEIPSLTTHWDISQDDSLRCSINLFPEPHTLSKAVADLVAQMKWRSFTLIYDEDESLIYLQEVLKLHRRDDPPITVRQLDPDNDHRPLLKEIQASGETHIVLHCHPDRLMGFLLQAKEVKMMEEYQSYIVTHLDSHTIDFGEFLYGRTNITSLRIVDPSGPDIMNAVRDWTQGELRYGRKIDITPNTVKAEAAFVYDSVYLFARAFHSLESPRNHIESENLFCDRVDKWTHGYGLASYMKLLTPVGLSGNMRFDSEGKRTYFELDIIELTREGFIKVGTWDPDQKVVYLRALEDLETQRMAEKMFNKTFIVTSRLGAPFLMEKESNETLYGNDRYEGYSINLIDEIAKELNFKYLFELAPDGKYGSFNKATKKWDGLVKQLLDRKADLAICDLTITHERKSAVDFTMPFMTLGISILYSKPIKQPPQLFSFLSPFSLDVWMYMATAYLGVSLLLFFLARMSPYEWDNPHPCVDTCEELENTFNLVNSLWFSLGSFMCQGSDLLPKISPYEWAKPHPCNNEADEMETNMNLHNSIWHNCGSLMQQGSDIAPKAVSTRLVAGMWWFFTLIMISSYTANLAAFLTLDRMEIEITNAEDLAKQSKIKYGAVADASTVAYFKNSNHSVYQRMWSNMESTRPSVFTSSNAEGVERVVKGKRGYAFLMESTSIEYQVERICELQQIGGLLDSKGYGIAMPVNSPYRTAISGAVLKMQEDGRLNDLKEKWWKQMHGGGNCQDEEEAKSDSAAELGLDNVGGVFVVLALGCVFGFFMAVLEFLWNIRKIAVEERITPKEALINELKFAINIKATTKPVPKKKGSREGSTSSSEPSARIVEDNMELARNNNFKH